MSSFIYFVRPVGMEGPIKIGQSQKPDERLLGLMTWSPIPLEIITTIPGDRRVEANIHDCFADDYMHREWFRPSQRLLAAIAKLSAGVPLSEAIDLSDKRGDLRAPFYERRSELRRARKAEGVAA